MTDREKMGRICSKVLISNFVYHCNADRSISSPDLQLPAVLGALLISVRGKHPPQAIMLDERCVYERLFYQHCVQYPSI
jgi:hypothetical protein